MIIFPAIDIMGGKGVRLYQGDFGKKETVGEDPLHMAVEFERRGAKALHLVDLDGAKEGESINGEIIVQLCKTLTIPVQVGGGIREMKTIERYLGGGARRVILGTKAAEDEEFLKAAVKKYAGAIAVALDCRDGFVATRGWQEATQIPYLEFTKKLEQIGIQTIIATDISRDGTLAGPGIQMLKELQQTTDMNIIASGGVASLEDIRRLKSMKLYGAITGKALYAGTLSLEDALKISEE